MSQKIELVDGLISTVLSGTVNVEDLINNARELASIEAEEGPSRHRISDITMMTGGNIDFAAMERFVALRKKAKLRNPVKSAIVAKSPLQIGLARMFQTLNDHPQIEIHIFNTREEALEWIEKGKAEERQGGGKARRRKGKAEG